MLQNSAPRRFELFDLAGLLSEAINCIKTLGESFEVTSSRLGDLRERLAQGRFHLAVLGQFKRGKSTLLNALLGEAVLPTAVIPLTAIPTFIRTGPELQATVFFQDDRLPEKFTATETENLNAFLAQFVTESGNPKNRLGVSNVEITHPADILEKGVVLIDTPGIGSTFRHNTEATLNFLPQCDASLFLVSSDPPLTEVEVEFLKQVRKKIPRLFFILNKVDYLGTNDRQAALEFLQRVLAEQAGIERNVPVFCVSAKQGLEARLTGDSRLWRQSGLEEVEHHLVEFLANEKSQTLHEAVGRKAGDVIADVMMRLHLAMRSLQMPLEELEKSLEIFERKIKEVQRQRLSAGDLLAGDQKRMHEFLEEHAKDLRAAAREYFESVVKETLAHQDGKDVNEKVIQATLSEAIPGYFEHQTGLTTELFQKRMTEALRPHQERAEELIEMIRRAAAELFEVPYHAPETERAFEMVRRPYWVTHTWITRLNPIPNGVVDKLLPPKTRRRRILKRVNAQISALVLSNVENLRWATYQSINETFRRFGSILDERLVDTITATHGAIRAAMEQRQKQGELVSQKVSRLKTAMHELTRLQEALECAFCGKTS